MPSAVSSAHSDSAAKARLLQDAAQEIDRIEDSLRRDSYRDFTFRDSAAFFAAAILLAFVLGYSAALLVNPESLLDIAKVRLHEAHR